MLKFKNKLIKPLPIIKLFPNFLTLLSLIIGLSAIRFSMNEKWEKAIWCVVIASLLDGFDGRIARLLNASSPLGAELDSLCDMVNFGVVPGLLLYFWALRYFYWPSFAWAVILFYVACMAIRLARFNISIKNFRNDKMMKYFFTGVPAPLGALLVMTPIIIDFDLNKILHISMKDCILEIIVYIIIVAILVASRLPTFSIKNIKVSSEYVWIFLLFITLISVMLIIYPWYILPILVVQYVISIPVSVIYAYRMNKNKSQ